MSVCVFLVVVLCGLGVVSPLAVPPKRRWMTDCRPTVVTCGMGPLLRQQGLPKGDHSGPTARKDFVRCSLIKEFKSFFVVCVIEEDQNDHVTSLGLYDFKLFWFI